MTRRITINRVPVLTVWAVVVAEHLGYDRDAAVTLGLNAHSKARRLGIIEASTDHGGQSDPRARKPGKTSVVPLLGRPVSAMNTDHGLRATRQDQPIDPRGVTRYLQQKFGHALPDVQVAIETLAKAYPPEQLAAQAYPLYESFRPGIPEGTRGWGAAGELDLDAMRSLAE